MNMPRSAHGFETMIPHICHVQMIDWVLIIEFQRSKFGGSVGTVMLRVCRRDHQ